ncbi:MAG: hypothetical protein HY737_06935 [Candidatus Omnitrophica bacterium]|nr:hypothetical protein [Candidatus Omnitrophota bacterium]
MMQRRSVPRARRHPRRGIILFLGLLLLTGIATLIPVTQMRAMQDLSMAKRTLAEQQALDAAEGGLDRAFQWIQTRPSPPPCAEQEDPCPIDHPYDGAQALPAGSYTMTITGPLANDTSTIDFFTISVTGESADGAASRAVSTTIRTENFARYAYFSNTEILAGGGGGVNFGTIDALYGPVHTNGQFNIDSSLVGVPPGTPIGPFFYDTVTSVWATVNCLHGCPPYDPLPANPPAPDTPQFYQGFQGGAAPIQLPVNDDRWAQLKTDSLVLPHDTTIQIVGQTLLVTNNDKGWVNEPVAVNGQAIYVEGGDLTITGGTLDGQLTLVSDRDIVLQDSVVYQCNPLELDTDLDCRDADGNVTQNNDVLGLVAQRHIKVVDNIPNDATVQASIMAVKGSFYYDGVMNEQPDGSVWKDPATVAPAKGTLHILGGLIQDRRGLIWMGGHGFSGKDYKYDTRFANLSPPFFPTTGKYETVLWQDQ